MKSSILLIYHESKTLDSFKIELQDEDFYIDAAESYESAEKKFFQKNFDIVILSLDIDFEKSLDLIKKIRDKSILIDIIAYAHFDSLEKILKAYKYGVNDFIRSPVEIKELKAKIISFSKKYEILNSKYFNNLVKYGDFVVDREANIVYLDTIPLDLSHREYRVLRALMKNQEKPLKKEEIQKLVWGYLDKNSKNVEVTISSLKKKINKPYIQTIFKEGYLLKLFLVK